MDTADTPNFDNYADAGAFGTLEVSENAGIDALLDDLGEPPLEVVIASGELFAVRFVVCGL